MRARKPKKRNRRWLKGWEEPRIDQLRRFARLPFAKKLEWLEEAGRIARQVQKSR